MGRFQREKAAYLIHSTVSILPFPTSGLTQTLTLSRLSTGQNPTSGVLSLQRRKEIYEVCSRFDILIVEDDPYWNLYYPSAVMLEAKHREGISTPESGGAANRLERLENGSTKHPFVDELVPSFLSIDTDGRVIRLDTFSKTIAPGCRLGYITAQPSIIEQLFRVTDATTQQPSGFVQAIVAKLISDIDISNTLTTNGSTHSTTWGFAGWLRWLENLRNQYQRRMITMATTLDQHRFTKTPTGAHEMFSFSYPRGGMFIWLKLHILQHPLASHVAPKRLAQALWILCTQEPYRIIMNPGRDFAANDKIREEKGFMYLRFCFAAVHEDILVEKSRAFTAACERFLEFESVEDIDRVLEEEDRLSSLANGATGEEEVERLADDG